MAALLDRSVRSWCRAHPLGTYFSLVFAIAWLVWLPMVASARGLIGVRLPPDLLWLAGLGPIGGATLAELAAGGRRGLRTLYGRLAVRGVPWQWYLIAATLPVAFGLATVALGSRAAGRSLPPGALRLAFLALGQGVLYAPVALFEEVGWRGCALPRLQARFSALAASLILGLVWAAWHLPLWALGAFAYPRMNLWWWIVDVLVVATLITWLYNNGRGSLWLPCLFHGAANMTAQTLTLPLAGDTRPLVPGLAALLVVVLYGPADLSRSRPRATVEGSFPAHDARSRHPDG